MSSANKSPAAGAADGASRQAGSTGGGGSLSSGSAPNAAAQPAAPGASAAPQAGSNPLTAVALASRSLVYTATLTVRLKDVQSAIANADQLAKADGGFVGDEKDSSGTVPNAVGITEATITLRVPSDKFDTVLGRLGTGGAVEQQTRSASDVTDQVVDTTSRISSAEASIARIGELMKSATGLPDVVSLEGELSRREADLESMKSRLASLQDQVQLSTITVTYLVPDAQVAAATPKKQNALQRGLHDGWAAFLGVAKVLLIVGGAALPFAILAVLLWWPARRLMRLRGAAPVYGGGAGVGNGTGAGSGIASSGTGPDEESASHLASGERSSASAAAVADGSK
jgi:hypothetical protein